MANGVWEVSPLQMKAESQELGRRIKAARTVCLFLNLKVNLKGDGTARGVGPCQRDGGDGEESELAAQPRPQTVCLSGRGLSLAQQASQQRRSKVDTTKPIGNL